MAYKNEKRNKEAECGGAKVVDEKIKDADIRKVLLPYLKERYKEEKGALILNEMGVLHGQSRVDVAVISDCLNGYEIKSESDTLMRLETQVTDYGRVFDRMTLVVQETHLEKAKEIIPKWWGILVVKKTKNGLTVTSLRKGRVNKKVDPLSLCHLLWREEALDWLKQKELQKGCLSKSRFFLYQKIVSHMALEEIQTFVRTTLKQRENWKS